MKNPKILFVEDETDLLLINSRYFGMHGFHVATAETIAEARQLLTEFWPDIVVLDIILPDGSGLDFCKIVKSYTNAPVLFLTCKGEHADILAGLAEGDDYLVKPADLEQMLARVRSQLRRVEILSAEIIKYPPLELNSMSQKATVDGVDVQLTPKEYQVLLMLAKGKGSVFPAYRIYKVIWDKEPAESDLNSVYVYISAIKKKLGITKETLFRIENMDNQGYCFTYRES